MSSLTSQEAIDLTIQCVPCSSCKALIGERCTSRMGKKIGASVCASRRWDMTAWRRFPMNKGLYKQRREEIASLRPKVIPSLISATTAEPISAPTETTEPDPKVD